MTPLGVLLAAGPGTRLGMPGALMVGDEGVPWVVRTVEVMRAAGCDPIGVVVGASSAEVVALLADEDVTIVPSPNWSDGLSASVRAGLAWATESDAPAALVHMVNRPRVGASVLRRVIDAAPTPSSPAPPTTATPATPSSSAAPTGPPHQPPPPATAPWAPTSKESPAH